MTTAMKFLLITFIFLSICNEVIGFGAHSDKAWSEFKVKFNKVFSASEESYRKNIFLENLNEIEEFNNGNHSFKQGINEFSDLTYKEAMKRLGIVNVKPTFKSVLTMKTNKTVFAPSENPSQIDWRNKDGIKFVAPVRNQGACGSCWAFSILGSLESLLYIKGKVKTLTMLSEQQLLDCWKRDCKGSWLEDPLEYIKKNGGVVADEAYPYTSQKGRVKQCSYDKYDNYKIIGTVTGYQNFESEDELTNAIGQIGPTSVIVCVAKTFLRYNSGIYDDPECNSKSSCKKLHAILAVGYGSEDGKNYWIVKNSWGEKWGEKGYIKIARGNNRCKIGDYPIIPTV